MESTRVLPPEQSFFSAETDQAQQSEYQTFENSARIDSKFAMKIQSALTLLHQAATLAQDAGTETWEFSVEITGLRDLGLTNSECRWMVAKGLASHAREASHLDAERRIFEPCANLSFTDRTCFVITPRGMAQASAVLRSGLATETNDGRATGFSSAPMRLAAGESELVARMPTWDSDRQQLRVGRQVVKQFKVPAANQEAILAAFQEEGWAPRIDDPLPPNPNQDSKRRLHDTINSLNRNQKNPLLRFLGDGKGEGIRWEFADSSRSAPTVGAAVSG
jgi:hypothetical protein